MSETARMILDGQEYEFPVISGSENEKAIDISKLRGSTGYITMDPGFKNTGSTQSGITYLCLLYTSPSPRDKRQSRMPSSA